MNDEALTVNIQQALGLGTGKKVRYAIVGLGDIAQEDLMPGVSHTGNSEISTLVTSDQTKATELGRKYNVKSTYTYEQFQTALSSGNFDAIYIGTPNWRHAEFILPALKAGIHVLTEKPLEVSSALCLEIMEAVDSSQAKLMVAYRLHFEPATLATIDLIRSGKLGKVHTFNSCFAQPLDPQNHRAHNGELAGPVFDMGPYPVNAARYVFEDEPTEVVSAYGVTYPESGFDQNFAHTVAVTLRFPGERIAQFNVGYFGGPVNDLTVVGTHGMVSLDPAYMFGKSLEQKVLIGKDATNIKYKNTDHFGGELKYFSNCILEGRDPEPNAEEGYADVRVLEGILEALKTGGAVKLAPFRRDRRIDTTEQKMELPAVSTPELVNAKNPGKGTYKQEKN